MTFKANDCSDANVVVSFAEFFAVNASLPETAHIIVTPSMKEILTKMMEGKVLNFMIRGPHGSGKTTTLYWLYHQLPAKGKTVKVIDAAMVQRSTASSYTNDHREFEVYLCDLNGIGELTQDKFISLKQYFSYLLIGKVQLVLATTSAFYASKKPTKLFGDFWFGFEGVQMECFDKETTQKYLGMTAIANSQQQTIPDETLIQVMKESGCFPGYLRHYHLAKCKLRVFTSTVQDAVCEHLQEALMHMSEVEYNYAVQLLVSVLCKAKVEPFVTLSVLEKTHMLYINEENLPTTHIPIHEIFLESTIQSLVKQGL